MSFYTEINTNGIDDERRLAYRREIQRKLAEIALTRQQLKQLQDEKRAHEQDSENAANEHSAVCEPLQAELKTLNEENIQAILAKKPVSQAVTDRRIEILKAISEQNQRLELRTEENTKNAKRLQREFETLRMETTEQTALENTLSRLASQELKDRHSCWNNRSEWAAKRLASAQAFIQLNKERIESEKESRRPSQENIRTYETRMSNYQILVDDAVKEVSELNRVLADLRQQMLDE